jgi:hypothetical protein
MAKWGWMAQHPARNSATQLTTSLEVMQLERRISGVENAPGNIEVINMALMGVATLSRKAVR